MFAITRKELTSGRSLHTSLVLGLLMIGSIAHAQYSVSVSSVGWSTASYNYTHTGAFTNLAQFGGATATVTPRDTVGDATAASASVSGNGPGYPHNPDTYDALSSSTDLSSLSTFMSAYDTGTDGVYTGNDGGTTYSGMHDNVTFNVAGADSSTHTVIQYTYTVWGYMRQSGSYADGHGEILSNWSLSGLGSGQADVKLDQSSGYQPYVNGLTGSGNFDTATPELIVQTGTFTIVGASVNTDFAMSFSAWDYNGMDESYRSSLQFSLAPEVSIASSSGVFATRPVPEPCSLAALLMGGVALVRKKRKG